MVTLNLPRILVVPMSVLSFVFFVIYEGLNSGFTYLTIFGGIVAAAAVYFVVGRLKMAEFDNSSITFISRQPKDLLGKRIYFKEIQKVFWIESSSVKIDFLSDGRNKTCGISGENAKIKKLVDAIGLNNPDVVIDIQNKRKLLSLEIPKPILFLLLFCFCFFLICLSVFMKKKGLIHF